MTDAEHAAFVRRFGPLEDHPLTSSVDGEPGIIHLWKMPDLTTPGPAPGSNAAPDELVASLRTASDKQGAMLQALGFKPE